MLGVLSALAVGALPRRPGADRRRPGREDRSALPARASRPARASTRATRRRSRSTPRPHRLFADHEDEVRVFGARGEEIPAQAKIAGLEDSHGVAFDPRRGALIVSEQGPGRIAAYSARATGRRGQLATHRRRRTCRSRSPDFEPERLAVAPGAAGGLYVIDAGNDAGPAVRSPRASYAGPLDAAEAPAGSFDFGDDDNDIAVDTARGPGTATSSSSPARATAPSGRSLRTGRFLWELKPESGDEFAALTVDAAGRPLDRRTGRRRLRVRRATTSRRSTGTDRRQDRRRRRSLRARLRRPGHLFVARELDGSLDTLGNVLSQIAHRARLPPGADGARVDARAPKGPREILERLGVRAFRPRRFEAGWG